MRAFTYVVAHDNGFAPNPYFGWCTLACCKPRIRSAAEPGDLVFGFSRGCERVVYAMRVRERLTFREYWADPRFEPKRAEWSSREPVKRLGDNIYAWDGEGGFKQLPSIHWDHSRRQERPFDKARDLGGRFALVATEFVYFGGDGPNLPPKLRFARVGRAHRCRFSPDQREILEKFFDGLPRGVQGRPSGWPFAGAAPTPHSVGAQPVVRPISDCSP